MKKLVSLLIVFLMIAFSGVSQATIMWGSASRNNWGDSTNTAPEIFKLDTSTGQVVSGSKWSYSNLNWIQGITDSGKYLYASGDDLNDAGQYNIYKINKSTGNIISTQDVHSLLGTDNTHMNALEYANGALYGVDNTTWDDTYRGHVIEFSLDGSGDVTGASVGAYIGLAPDGGLDFYNGDFYASSWKSGGNPGESWIATIGAANIGDNTKSFAQTLFTNPASGLMSGWQFDENGDIISVSWQNNGLYNIDPADGDTSVITAGINGLSSGLYMDGLDAQVPEPASILLFGLGILGLAGVSRKKA